MAFPASQHLTTSGFLITIEVEKSTTTNAANFENVLVHFQILWKVSYS